MNEDIYTELRVERQNELRAEVTRAHLARELSRGRETLGRRAVGKLGSLMVAAGSRLEKFEQDGRPAVVDTL